MSNNPNQPKINLPPVQPIKYTNPFTQADLQNIKTLRANLDVAQKHLDAMKKIGLDTSNQQAQIDAGKKTLDGIIQHYGNPLNFS